MTGDEHRKRHVLLYYYLDELMADLVMHRDGIKILETPIAVLYQWSQEQARNPTHENHLGRRGKYRDDGKQIGEEQKEREL